MNLSDEITIEKRAIRHQKDPVTGLFYFSIVDVIDVLGLSKDSRNYWKVLKSRLKNTHKELVTECNQAKLKSIDGKYYLTDVANEYTILKIVEIISPTKVVFMREILEEIEVKNERNFFSNDTYESEGKKISTDTYDDGEISVDIYQKSNSIFVTALLAGVNPENIFVSVNCKTLTLKINRLRQEKVNDSDYYFRELSWGKFSKVIDLPYEVDIDRVETNFKYGVLSIELLMIDKERVRVVKIK
jgi:HSP20 family molecular chaperone IbpA